MISAVFLGVEGVAGDHGVGEKGGGLLEKYLANGEFAVVLFPAVGAHGYRNSVVMVAEGDDGSEFTFSAEIFAVDGEGLG